MIDKAVEIIKNSDRVTGFTGAGISVESGIPPFRGENGLLERKWIELYCKGDWESCIRYHLQERGQSYPNWMLPDGTIGEKLCRKRV
ncbi:MAG: hypothetical protein KAW47_01715 [Thermoplasmatales archaeon]|nr:hypothetical protein [Thermoplasmatales archaeon]